MTPNDLPIVDHPTDEASALLPKNLLKRSAAMLSREHGHLPRCCVLDMDGELVPVARERFAAAPCSVWPCFHTVLYRMEGSGIDMGLIGGTVGAPFAVLIAEQLIALGCQHILAYSSSGAVSDQLTLPCLVVPERALRDEGTSYHYLPPARWAHYTGKLPDIVARHAARVGLPVHRGTTWTTDAPYRETRIQIQRHREEGILTVEMEAAALMALAQTRGVEIASLLHVTNAFATEDNDFHKGPGDTNQKVVKCCFAAFAEAMATSCKLA